MDRVPDAPNAPDASNAPDAPAVSDGPDASGPADDGVAVRTLLLVGLPLLVASITDHGRGPLLRAALEERGVVTMPRFLGEELPRGAEVGFMLGTTGLRLVDDRDDDLLRMPRGGLDPDWLTEARRLRGTMAVVIRGATSTIDLEPAALAMLVEERACAGDAWGAIVGFAEERPMLPLMF